MELRSDARNVKECLELQQKTSGWINQEIQTPIAGPVGGIHQKKTSESAGRRTD